MYKNGWQKRYVDEIPLTTKIHLKTVTFNDLYSGEYSLIFVRTDNAFVDEYNALVARIKISSPDEMDKFTLETAKLLWQVACNPPKGTMQIDLLNPEDIVKLKQRIDGWHEFDG